MNIFFIGDPAPNSTARHRADALQRCGHKVTLVDVMAAFDPGPWPGSFWRLHYRTSYRLLQRQARAILEERLEDILAHDLVWVDGGEVFGAHCIKFLRQTGVRTVLVNVDDPTGGRDGPRFGSLRAAIPHYDLCVTFREPTLIDLRRQGARRALRARFGYDEIYHAPPDETEQASSTYPAGVVFIGTWMKAENRDETLATLIQRGLPVSIFGGRWQASSHWQVLKSAWRGPALYGRDYVLAINSADVCLGFLSSGNRDSHTTRSLEIPYAGGLLVAQRTSDHEDFYGDGREAVFWSDPEDCARKCRRLLENPAEAARIREAGMRRVRALGVGNESLVTAILDAATEPQRTQA